MCCFLMRMESTFIIFLSGIMRSLRVAVVALAGLALAAHAASGPPLTPQEEMEKIARGPSPAEDMKSKMNKECLLFFSLSVMMSLSASCHPYPSCSLSVSVFNVPADGENKLPLMETPSFCLSVSPILSLSFLLSVLHEALL